MDIDFRIQSDTQEEAMADAKGEDKKLKD